MRSLHFRHGRAFIAASSEAWPRLHWDDVAADTTEHAFAATAQGSASAVAVQLACQTASGASFFTRLGGHLTPHEDGALVVRMRLPIESELGPTIERAVQAGLASMQAHERPSGMLELAWLAVHEVDFKTWAWSRAAATVCRLLCGDVVGMSDEQASSLAAEVAAYRHA